MNIKSGLKIDIWAKDLSEEKVYSKYQKEEFNSIAKIKESQHKALIWSYFEYNIPQNHF